jgi:hypothetical protein
MAFGTLQIFDTIEARRVAANNYINQFDEQTLYRQIQAFLEVHNRLMDEMTSDIVEPTSERFLTWGNVAQTSMQDGDEFSRPDVQKMSVSPTTMGFPLYIKQAAYGVTRLFMETKTLGDLEQVVLAATDADVRERLKMIRRSLFNPTNNLTYKDRFEDNATLPLRALLNADSAYIPPDMWGNTFDGSTHTHYSGTSSFTAANLTALITNVLEHYNDGTIMVDINRAQETTIRGFTGFYPYYDARITPSVNQDVAQGRALDQFNVYNRPIGIFGASEIWVKPWVPANYVFAYNTAAPKPLRMRTRNPQRGNLHIAAELEIYPLRATYMEREFGISVFERTNGAVLKTDNATYSAPADWAL